MSVIVILLAVSLSIAIVFLFAFIWSVKEGQYDDEFSPPHRILFDDKRGPGDTPLPDKDINQLINKT